MLLVFALAPGLKLSALLGCAPLVGLAVLLVVATPAAAGDKGKVTLLRVPFQARCSL